MSEREKARKCGCERETLRIHYQVFTCLCRHVQCFKGHLIMELLKAFVLRLQVRVGKETATVLAVRL